MSKHVQTYLNSILVNLMVNLVNPTVDYSNPCNSIIMFHVLVILWGNAKPTATSRNATVLSIHFAILSSNQPWLAINESSNMKAIYKWWMFYCYVWFSEGDPSLSKAQKIRITRGGHILEYLEILCIYACIHIYMKSYEYIAIFFQMFAIFWS